MDSIETSIRSALDGRTIGDKQEFCDYSLEDQIKELTLRGVESQLPTSFIPQNRQTVTYIVAAVIFNEKNEVLMMQEAKESCAGTWYLPAGRLESGEQLIDGVKREVMEETGMTFEPASLLMVESSRGTWYRFVFTGRVTGGLLKTVAQADAESLQADWVGDIETLDLRSEDILPLIECGRAFYNTPQTKIFLPQATPHKRMLLRLVVAIRKKENNRVHVLVSERGSPHLPTCEINPNRSLYASLKRFMQAMFSLDQLPEHKPHGILSVEHSGQPQQEHDGLCLTMLISCKVPLESAIPTTAYTWLQVDPELEVRILNKLKNVNILLKQR